MRRGGIAAVWGLAVSIVTLATGGPVLARTEIEFWHGQPGANGQRLVELVQRFNDAQAEYEVKPLFTRSGGSTLSAVIAAYRARRPPHIALIPDTGTYLMLLSGATVPVERLVQQHGVVLEGGSFLRPIRACFVKNGELHALPLSPSTMLLYYNRDAFRRAGLDPGRPPATFDEIEAAATRVVATRSAKCGFTYAWPAPTFEMLHSWHAQPIAERQDGHAGPPRTLLVNGEFATRFWDTLVRWQRAGLHTYGGRSRQGELLFAGGQCAITIAGAGLGGSLAATGLDWGVGPLPRFPGFPLGRAQIQGSALWVLDGHGTAEYRGVARFLAFVSRIDQQVWWYRATGYLPASHETVQRLRAQDWFARHPSHAVALAQLGDADGSAPPPCLRVGNLGAIRDVIESELESVLAGLKPPRTALDDVVRRGNELLREFADLYR